MKTCSTCKITKNKSEFAKRKKYKDGLECQCRECTNKTYYAYLKTKKGVIAKIYSNQRSNSKSKHRRMPEYSIKWFREWMLSKQEFHDIYNVYVRGDYAKDLIPSADRIDDSKGYTKDNIQIMTWEENNKKGSDCIRSGKIIHGNNPQKAVLQYTFENEFIKEYISMSEASRQTNTPLNHISLCCMNKKSDAGGYNWKLKSQ